MPDPQHEESGSSDFTAWVPDDDDREPLPYNDESNQRQDVPGAEDPPHPSGAEPSA